MSGKDAGRPPHILVTTPESLYILLTAEKSRRNLRDVETVIVDEIHAVAGDKRGAHLLLSLERLEAVTAKPPVRIGLSATQKPMEQIAEFLTGAERPSPVMVDVGHAADGPGDRSSASGNGADRNQRAVGRDLRPDSGIVAQHRSTLVFVNTRRQVERVSLHIGERLGEDRGRTSWIWPVRCASKQSAD